MGVVHLIKKVASQCRFTGTLLLAGLLLASTSCLASTVTLQWDPVTVTDFAGYRVYYSADSSDLPFVGSGATEGASPLTVTNQTSATITGLDPSRAYYFAVTAYNSAGLESNYSNIVSVPELVPPTVSITSPADHSLATGTVSVSASASDNVAVTRLEFYLNGVLQVSDGAPPYLFSWDTSAVPSGLYTLAAKAYDAAGNVGQSGAVSVTVQKDITAPTVSLAAPATGVTMHGKLQVSANATDDVAVTKVELYANDALLFAGNVAPYSYLWDTAAVADGSYAIYAKAYDAAGNVGQSSPVSLTVVSDTTPPVVGIATPSAGSTVSGTVGVTANASDNVAVTRVEFYLNGVLQSVSSSAPYGYLWDTSQLSNGIYSIAAKAYDGAGNESNLAVVSVSLANALKRNGSGKNNK